MVQATLRFTPGMIKSASGDELTWTHDDQTTAPHTATIVAGFPEPTLDAVFGCGAPGEPCAEALAAHNVFGPVVNTGGPGLDAPGDSLSFFDVDLGGGHRALGHDVAVPVRSIPGCRARSSSVATSRGQALGRERDRLRRLVDFGSGSGSEISPAMVVDTSIAPARGVSGWTRPAWP